MAIGILVLNPGDPGLGLQGRAAVYPKAKMNGPQLSLLMQGEKYLFSRLESLSSNKDAYNISLFALVDGGSGGSVIYFGRQCLRCSSLHFQVFVRDEPLTDRRCRTLLCH